MVAKFSNEITPDAHYIKHSDNPTCYLIDNQVFTLKDLESFTELTLNFDLK